MAHILWHQSMLKKKKKDCARVIYNRLFFVVVVIFPLSLLCFGSAHMETEPSVIPKLHTGFKSVHLKHFLPFPQSVLSRILRST